MVAVAKIHKQNTNFKFHNLFSLTEQIIYIIAWSRDSDRTESIIWNDSAEPFSPNISLSIDIMIMTNSAQDNW